MNYHNKVEIVPKIKSFKRVDVEQLLTSADFKIVENWKLDETSNQYFIVAKK